jgi:hypothetical protein
MFNSATFTFPFAVAVEFTGPPPKREKDIRIWAGFTEQHLADGYARLLRREGRVVWVFSEAYSRRFKPIKAREQ